MLRAKAKKAMVQLMYVACWLIIWIKSWKLPTGKPWSKTRAAEESSLISVLGRID